ncbi:TPA: hypothetical protein ACH3X1_007859 [Trebouxia sp. C0004]
MDYQPVLVMGVGLLLGSVIRGVTGFGSSIALLSTWVISRAVGIRTSTFQQLVLTDSLSALVASPPLLYVTNARRFTDWRLVFTAVTFQVVGSPIGAYLLLHLDSAHLQLSIAGVLTLVFLSMVVTPAQFKQSWKSLKDKLASHKKVQHAQREGYSTLPPTPTFGAMHYTDTPKSSATELSQAKPYDSSPKGGNIPQESQILKPNALPVPVVSTSSGSGSGNSSSSLGNLAPQAPPPINIHPPSSAPPASAEFPLNSSHSNWSVQHSNYGGSRRGSMTAASFNPQSLQSRLDSESSVSILARHNARQAPPVVRVSQASLDLVKQDVQSYHSSSPAMSWMWRLQPDPSTVVINYPVEYSLEDVESGQSPLPSPVPTPVPTRPPSPSPHADTSSEACRQERMMVAVTTDPDEHPIPADADGSHDGVSAVMAEYKLAEHEKNRAWKILGAGSVAGTLSGLMGTLAGQPGPPLILMFALLKVPKVLTISTCLTSDKTRTLLL